MFAKTTLAALAAATPLAAAGFAHAAPVAGPSANAAVSTPVLVADLDLRTDDGARIALKRIYGAATRVCGDELNPLACRTYAVRHAVATLDSPIVTALEGGHARPTTILAVSGR